MYVCFAFVMAAGTLHTLHHSLFAYSTMHRGVCVLFVGVTQIKCVVLQQQISIRASFDDDNDSVMLCGTNFKRV